MLVFLEEVSFIRERAPFWTEAHEVGTTFIVKNKTALAFSTVGEAADFAAECFATDVFFLSTVVSVGPDLGVFTSFCCPR